jgi:hypothetical protein
MVTHETEAFITGLKNHDTPLPEPEPIFKVEDTRPPIDLEGDLQLPANVKLSD